MRVNLPDQVTPEQEVARTVDAVWRIQAPRLIAGLARFCNGDIGRAEDLAQDAMLIALERWPIDGTPRNPGAWLMTTAKNRQIDLARRTEVFRRKRDELGHVSERSGPSPAEHDEIEDDVLRLIFTVCHPTLTRDSQVALALRLLGGLSTDEIARAFLTSSATIGTRISRAKRSLADAGSPFEVPGADELETRLAAVLAVIYLIFNEGYSATSGEQWMRIELCEDALRLGRILQFQLPSEPEVHGLAALMEIQSSRARARSDASGDAIPLLEQDRKLWDRTLIDRGLWAIERAHEPAKAPGSYTLQAEIAACHARAATPDQTDWSRIAELYAALAELTVSPIVELNRAVAVSYAYGPAEGIALLDRVAGAPELEGNPHLHGVRGDLLARAGRASEAADAFDRAAATTRNQREREIFESRAAALRAKAGR